MPTIKQLFDLSGRAAIVTGGSRGLGLEMAEGLAEAGAALMLCARREEWLTPAVTDMTRARLYGRRRALRRLEAGRTCRRSSIRRCRRFGKVDILINNAGVTWGESPKPCRSTSGTKVIDANLTGRFCSAQAAGREMLEAVSGDASSTSRPSPGCIRSGERSALCRRTPRARRG